MRLGRLLGWGSLVAGIVAGLSVPRAEAGTVSGSVFFDDDGDGLFGIDEEPAVGVVVYFGTAVRTATDEAGAFTLEAPDRADIVWARAQDGMTPTPVWRKVPSSGADGVDLPMTRAAPGELRFAVISDLHTGIEHVTPEDIGSALDVVDATADLSFVVATGDLTSGNQPVEFATLADLLLDMKAPFVPVPGNHDWYDGGATYRENLGPTSYSFDSGGVRFVVLADGSADADLIAFLERDLVDASDAMIVAFMHAPPGPPFTAELERVGVDTLFTGHLHANRVLRHEAFTEFNTQPLAMGGIDSSPGGFRIVELGADGELSQTHQTVMTEPGTPDVAAPTASFDFSLAEWPQLQGKASRTGTREREITPPLVELWATDVGDELYGGSPVVSDSVIVVPIADFGDGSRGGVVALDGATGDELWRARVGASVRNAAAIEDGVVVVGALDGRVLAFDLHSGAELWSQVVAPDLEPQVTPIYAAPLIVDGVVFTGFQREFLALDLYSGEVQWSAVPLATDGFYGSTSSPAATDDGLILASFAGGSRGLFAYDAGTGELVWKSEKRATSYAMASPVIAGDVAFVIDWTTTLSAVDTSDGSIRFRRKIVDDSFKWAFGVVGTPAYADDILYVGTQHGSLVALEVGSGKPLWRADTGMGRLRASHYQGQVGSVTASPVVTGALVWFGGNDGVLRAHDVTSGDLAWQVDLGAAVMMGPAPAGDALIVATQDGIVRALGLQPGTEPLDDPAETDGCGCRAGEGGGSPWPLALLTALLCRLPRRRASR